MSLWIRNGEIVTASDRTVADIFVKDGRVAAIGQDLASQAAGADGELYRVMQEAAKLRAIVTVHAENGDAVWQLQRELVAKGDLGPEYHPVSRPSSVEGEATNRALMMARLHGTTAYIVHMTCRESVESLVRAKLEGQLCFGEMCRQYLLLDDSVFVKLNCEDAMYVMRPPLRPSYIGHHDST